MPVGLAPKLAYKPALGGSQTDVLNQFLMKIKGLEARLVAFHGGFL